MQPVITSLTILYIKINHNRKESNHINDFKGSRSRKPRKKFEIFHFGCAKLNAQ